MKKKMLKRAIKFGNGMVMVFDEKGEQMPEYQGRYSEVKEKILHDANDETIFETGIFGKASQKTPKEDW